MFIPIHSFFTDVEMLITIPSVHYGIEEIFIPLICLGELFWLVPICMVPNIYSKGPSDSVATPESFHKRIWTAVAYFSSLFLLSFTLICTWILETIFNVFYALQTNCLD